MAILLGSVADDFTGATDLANTLVKAGMRTIQLLGVPRAKLEKFAGTYQLFPNFALTVTLEGDQLMSQATGQPKFPLFAESETKFFFKVVDAQLEFFTGADGGVTHAVLYQGGREMKGERK